MATESIDSNNEPKNALKKPLISTPGTRYPANIKSSAFITSVNIPSVKMFIGKVKNISTGFITALIKPITTAAIRAVQKFSICIPGITQATNIIISAKAIHFKSIFTIITLSPLFHYYSIRFCEKFNPLRV